MRRREFIAGLGGAVVWPLVARAQQAALPIIGWLHATSPQATRDSIPAFYRGLAEMGFGEGRNVAVEHRWAEGHADRRAALAADLVRRQVVPAAASIAILVGVAGSQYSEAETRDLQSAARVLGVRVQVSRRRTKLPQSLRHLWNSGPAQC
jgi:hypothetical protein